VVQAQDPDPSSFECLPHVPAVERWKHPGEACSVGDEVPADDDPAKYRLQYPVVSDSDEDTAIFMPSIDNI
jgi:hypothetical protein